MKNFATLLLSAFIVKAQMIPPPAASNCVAAAGYEVYWTDVMRLANECPKQDTSCVCRNIAMLPHAIDRCPASPEFASIKQQANSIIASYEKN